MAKWLKRILIGVLSFGFTTVIAACYGGYDVVTKLVKGKVSNNGVPLADVSVCLFISEQIAATDCTNTDEAGGFNLYGDDRYFYSSGGNIHVNQKGSYGSYNGNYETKEVAIEPPASLPVIVEVQLNRVK